MSEVTETPQAAETKSILERSLSRRTVLKALLAGGAAAALTACGISPEEEKNIPNIDLRELVNHPDLYANLPLLKTQGYPEKAGKKTVSVPILVPAGKALIVNWLTTETDFYNLHETADPKSLSVGMVVDGGITYFPTIPLAPSGSHLEISDKYEVAGKMSKIKEADGTEKYVFKPSNQVKTPRKITPAVNQTGK